MFRVINGTKLFSLHFEDPRGAVCGVEKIRHALDCKDIVLTLRAKDSFLDDIHVSLRELAKNGGWKIEGQPTAIFLEGIYRQLQNEIVKIPKELCDYYNNPRSVFVYWPPPEPPEWINPQILTYLSDETPRNLRKKLKEMLEDDRTYWIDDENLGKGRNKIWPKLRELPFSLAENLALGSKKHADKISGFEIRTHRLVNLANIACRAGRTLSPKNFLIQFKRIASWIWKMMIAPAKVIKICAGKIMVQTFKWGSYYGKMIKESLREVLRISPMRLVLWTKMAIKRTKSSTTHTPAISFRELPKSSSVKIKVGVLLLPGGFFLLMVVHSTGLLVILFPFTLIFFLVPMCSVYMVRSGVIELCLIKRKDDDASHN